MDCILASAETDFDIFRAFLVVELPIQLDLSREQFIESPNSKIICLSMKFHTNSVLNFYIKQYLVSKWSSQVYEWCQRTAHTNKNRIHYLGTMNLTISYPAQQKKSKIFLPIDSDLLHLPVYPPPHW